jgi:hypothetical protein
MTALPTTIRRLALVAIAGGAAMIIANVLLFVQPSASGLDSASDYLVEGVVALSLLLSLAGLIGVQLRKAETYGALGTVGFVLALVGQAASVADAFSVDRLLYVVTTLPAIVGYFVLALAILRSPALPHWIGFLLFVGFVAFWVLAEGDEGIALDGVVWIVVGYALWSNWSETAPAARARTSESAPSRT